MRKINFFKEAGAILILAALIISTTAVLGQNINIKTKNATTLTEISQTGSKVINNKPLPVRGSVLWDNGLPDGANGLSCVLRPSTQMNRLVIDDFYVPEGGWIVGDGHFRIVTNTGAGPEAIENVKVYFFYNTGPCEPNMVEYLILDPDFTAVLTGNTYFGRPEIFVTVVFNPPISLPMAGEWWVCFQPQMEDNCFWLTAAQKYCSVFLDYSDVPYLRWTWGKSVFGVEYDVSFVLTDAQQCNPSIDVEKYVKDKKGEWQDADTETEAVDLPICTNVTFKIVITNTGDCPLINLKVFDTMHKSLKFVSADPEPVKYWYEDPFWYMEWYITWLDPDQTIEIYLTAHVEGPECSIDYNQVKVDGTCLHGIPVFDEDYAYVHAIKKGKSLNMPLINFIQSHTYLLRILQKLLRLEL